jgi:hypothetical protein
MSRIISLAERKKKLRQEIDSFRSPSERRMERQLEQLLELVDELDARVQDLELRQLQLVCFH